MSGLNNAWKGVRKVSKIATYTEPVMLPHLKMFRTSIHPTDKDVDPKQEDEAPADGLQALKSTSAAISI
jgi:hypothetical protein